AGGEQLSDYQYQKARFASPKRERGDPSLALRASEGYSHYFLRNRFHRLDSFPWSAGVVLGEVTRGCGRVPASVPTLAAVWILVGGGGRPAAGFSGAAGSGCGGGRSSPPGKCGVAEGGSGNPPMLGTGGGMIGAMPLVP